MSQNQENTTTQLNTPTSSPVCSIRCPPCNRLTTSHTYKVICKTCDKFYRKKWWMIIHDNLEELKKTTKEPEIFGQVLKYYIDKLGPCKNASGLKFKIDADGFCFDPRTCNYCRFYRTIKVCFWIPNYRMVGDRDLMDILEFLRINNDAILNKLRRGHFLMILYIPGCRRVK